MSVSKYSSCKLPTLHGYFDLTVFRSEREEEISVISSQDISESLVPFVRIHSQCFTAEVLGSMKCDCREQLQYALDRIGNGKEPGVVIYLPQEGRGIGLGNKVKAYQLQEEGADTLEANHMLGFEGDLRDFQLAADILKQMGLIKIRLNTNNPEKIECIINNGIQIEEIVPSIGHENTFNKNYLKTKAEKMGHVQLMGIPTKPVSCDSIKRPNPE